MKRRTFLFLSALAALLPMALIPREAKAALQTLKLRVVDESARLPILEPRPLDADGLVRVPLNYWPGKPMVNGDVYHPKMMMEMLTQGDHRGAHDEGIVWDRPPETPIKYPNIMVLGAVMEVTFFSLDPEYRDGDEIPWNYPFRVEFLVKPFEDGTQGALWLRDPSVFITTAMDFDIDMTGDDLVITQDTRWADLPEGSFIMQPRKLIGLFATREFPEYMRFEPA